MMSTIIRAGGSTLVLDKVSRWFGNVVAVNDVSLTVGPGVTGLLGPNGAGKTTLMAMMSGFLPPSAGSVLLDGNPVWRNTEAYRLIGLVPEREISFGYLSGRQFVRANADLHRLPDAAEACEKALARVDMVEPAGRRIGTYSKGMRQRVKIAAALVHDPGVLLLDEPFNGVDPRQRVQLMTLLHQMGEEGRTILFSSHILEEVERLARHVEVVVSGRHAASGDFQAIRRLMTDRPVQYLLRTTDDRVLASRLVIHPSVEAVRVTPAGLEVAVNDLGQFAAGLPGWARADDISLLEVSPSDESLESVFSYLVAR
jgi:ABC-2 type transport system ATP-binding protein